MSDERMNVAVKEIRHEIATILNYFSADMVRQTRQGLRIGWSTNLVLATSHTTTKFYLLMSTNVIVLHRNVLKQGGRSK